MGSVKGDFVENLWRAYEAGFEAGWEAAAAETGRPRLPKHMTGFVRGAGKMTATGHRTRSFVGFLEAEGLLGAAMRRRFTLEGDAVSESSVESP